MWRHLKRLKRAGRGNVERGWSNVPPGSLAVICPACPRAGINVPDGWENLPDNVKYVRRPHTCFSSYTVAFHRFIYTLFVAMDANFRLKRRAVSSDERDPALASGGGYFVEDKEYKEYLLAHVDQEEVCSR